MYKVQQIFHLDESVAEEILHRALTEGALWAAYICDPVSQDIQGVYIGWDREKPKKPSKVLL